MLECKGEINTVKYSIKLEVIQRTSFSKLPGDYFFNRNTFKYPNSQTRRLSN